MDAAALFLQISIHHEQRPAKLSETYRGFHFLSFGGSCCGFFSYAAAICHFVAAAQVMHCLYSCGRPLLRRFGLLRADENQDAQHRSAGGGRECLHRLLRYGRSSKLQTAEKLPAPTSRQPPNLKLQWP